MGLFSGKDITGVDIGAGSIKVVRIAHAGRKPRLVSAAIIEIPPDPDTAPAVGTDLRYLHAEKKIGRGQIVALMPGKDLTIRSLTLPKIPLAEVGEAVRWEAKRHISYPLDAAQVEYLIVGEKQDGVASKYDIVMIAAERSRILERLQPFHEAGISVSAVDATPLALRNVLRLRRTPVDANTLVVDIGAGKTEINIFNGGALRFSRCIESGGLDMTRAVAFALGIEVAEAEEKKRGLDLLASPENDRAVAEVRHKFDTLLMEIRRSVEYYKTIFRVNDVQTMVLTGGGSLMQGVREYFTQALDHAVELDQPFEGLTGNGALLQELSPVAQRFSAAVGLALRKE